MTEQEEVYMVLSIGTNSECSIDHTLTFKSKREARATFARAVRLLHLEGRVLLLRASILEERRPL